MNALPPFPARMSRARRRPGGVALVLAAAAFAAGCAATRPVPTLLALPPAVRLDAPAQPPAAADAPRLVLRRLALPEYLLARRVRYRADAATLGDWPNTFWAERIEIAATREFAGALREALPAWSVCEADCVEGAPRLALQVELSALDYLRGEQRLRGRARIVVADMAASTATTPRAVQERVFDVPAAADTPQAHAETVTELLRQLARAAATQVGQVGAAAAAR
jgi:uncharacterized lipoprotein YmbA